MDRARFASFAAFVLLSSVFSAAVAPVTSPAFAAAARTATPLELARSAIAAGVDESATTVKDMDANPAAAPWDGRELQRSRFTLDGHLLPKAHYHRRAAARSAAAPTPPVGTVREWLGLDNTTGKYYRKNYTLRAVGKHIEVWVAQDLDFPAGDCRKDSLDVTDAQVANLIREFDGTIYPKETSVFSTPPARDGTHATTDGDFTGDGDKTVTLVDNVRDENYYHFPQAVTYTAGFFSPQLNELFDRNVMTIDAYDWKHRMGPDPADDPSSDLCLSRPAHPYMYEATFAHEWQHLLEYYKDPDEVTWVNEGLSDFAQTLTGYVDSRATVNQRGIDNHINCFQGFGNVKTAFNPNPRDCGGPQNSLNLWDEGMPIDVLADYGNAYDFMLYLRDRFGLATISHLHSDGAHQGLDGVQAALPPGTRLYDAVHDYQLMTLLDRSIGRPGGQVTGVPRSTVVAADLRSTVNLVNPTAYDTPGAAPNGADYVPLPTPLRSVSFQGATKLPPLATGWTVVDDTLFSGNKNDLNNSAVLPITVPTRNPHLDIEAAWDIEEAYDFAYVEISTDGGRTYTPIAGDRTIPGPLGPGITGSSGGVLRAGYDLTPYAGKNVLLALRYVSDVVVGKGGWRVGKITLGDKVISDGSTLAGWKSSTELQPTLISADAWHVVLVGMSGRRAAVVPIDQFAQLAGYRKVVAVVSYDDPTEKVTQYAPYQLTVNGTVQPGGAPLSQPLS